MKLKAETELANPNCDNQDDLDDRDDMDDDSPDPKQK